MPGLKRARRFGATAGSSKGLPGSWAVVMGAALALLASVTNCGFPSYDFHPDSASGAGGVDGGARGGGTDSGGTDSGGTDGGASAGAGIPDASGDGGMASQAGEGGGGADGGAAGAACEYPKPVVYPAHCFDQMKADGETGTDCGGGTCSACAGTQTCASNDDCLSGKCGTGKTCTPVFLAEYTSIVGDFLVRSPKFRLVLTYQDPASTTLDAIRVRYYFNHNDVTEPVLGLNSQATLDYGSAQLNIPVDKIHAQVYRSLVGPAAPNNGRKADSYLEISFTSSALVAKDTKLNITQDFWASSSDSLFDQRTHYSFFDGTNANETVIVYRDAKRVWGIEPPWIEFPACAYAGGVNVNGAALTVSGEELGAASEAQLTFTGGGEYADATANAFPATDANTAKLLTTASSLTGTATASWVVPNGRYYAFAWLTSAANSDAGVLAIQDKLCDKFVGSRNNTAAAWSLLGPYPVTISNQTLGLAVASGSVYVAGLKLYRAE
ncbi:MAG: hypothetical protein ABIQ16_22970 [Polyangiaceae bacterium]